MSTAPTTLAPKPRVAWVDVARCLAMFFIMWMHAGEAPGWLGKPVGGGICLFFAMAGYFMPREAGKCAWRALKLGLAWLLWSLISLGLFLLVNPDLQWTWGKVFGWGTSAYNVPLWFLRNLTIFQLIIAALAALRILPRYNWLVFVLLLSFSWAAEPRQHLGLRFDWIQAVMLGYCLRCFSLESICLWLRRNTPALLIGIAILHAQLTWYPDVLKHFGISGYSCSLPLDSLSYAVLYCLVGIAMEQYLPRLARPLATAGGCMLFTYAAHSLLYAPVYCFKLHGFYDVWIPFAGLIILTAMGTWLTRKCPRTMRLLCAK